MYINIHIYSTLFMFPQLALPALASQSFAISSRAVSMLRRCLVASLRACITWRDHHPNGGWHGVYPLKIIIFDGKSTISMAFSNSKLLVYQRVPHISLDAVAACRSPQIRPSFGLGTNWSWWFQLVKTHTGWWLGHPSEKYESIGMIIPNIWENKIDVPNHQPAHIFFHT